MDPGSKNPKDVPISDTWRVVPRRLVSQKLQQPCLVHIYPTGPSMGLRYELGEEPLVLGRGEECDIRINDHSVSRRHARIENTGETYAATDLQSTNGTFVNHARAANSPLQDGDYLRIGNCIFRFLGGGNVEAEYHEEIYRLTIVDALTGIHNKRFLLEFLEREVARSVRHRRPLAVVLFDIDHFKAINDELGHLAGDYTLRELAGLMRNKVRREDLFARYGGEEFALVLVEASPQGASDLAERMRVLVEQKSFEYEGKPFNLTISLGVATVTGEEAITVNDLIQRADEKLLEAKRTGRNRVVS